MVGVSLMILASLMFGVSLMILASLIVGVSLMILASWCQFNDSIHTATN
jgi:hypothetical protein